MTNIVYIELIIVNAWLVTNVSSKITIVETLTGPVEGSRVETIDPRTKEPISYDEFLTIPFAEPPLGEKRFAPPEPVKPWKTLEKNVPYTRVCYQVANGFGLVPGLDSDEDCLYLNVYVPAPHSRDDRAPLPVLIWFTGGAFIFGGGIWYGPNLWMTHEIIVVTVNYRVGPFGFLTVGSE